ncbi:ABC transporter ATP-binding protein [bacterium]|nr:ABC transporter ATP-binding protein [bacterium]
MLLGALAEVATLGAVVPFLSIMASPEAATGYPLLGNLIGALNLTTADFLLVSASLFSLVAVVAAAIRLTVVWLTTRFVFGVGHDLGVGVYDKTLHQPYVWHAARNSSESLAAINKVQIVTSGGLLPLLQSIVAIVIATFIVGALIFIDAPTALLGAGGFAGSYLAISLVVRKRIKANGRIIANAQGSRIQAVQEGVGGIRDVLIDATQPVFLQRFRTQDGAFRHAQATNQLLGQSPRYALEGAALVLISLLAWRLALTEGGMQGALPVLGALALGGQKLIPLLQQIYNGWTKMSGAHATIVDVLNLLELPAEPVARPLPLEFGAAVQLADLGFRYASDGPDVLRDINLTIHKGQRLGLIGKTGSGKSTLTDIIMGLLPPSDGGMTVDGVEVDAANRNRWQARIAHVPQSIFLTDDTVRRNIAFGVEDADIDDDRVRKAAQDASIAGYIESLSEGYDALVGERGIRFSGGQRQRLGIARALYKNADVLILDEATSALDDATERAVIECVDRLSRELTVIMIAHRVTTLRGCDLIVELSTGQIKRSGSYNEIVGRPASTA